MDAGKLRDKAAAAVAKGKHSKALGLYEKLSEVDFDDGMWPRKEGEMYRNLGDNEAAIEAFGRACDRYARMGFIVKAVATCQLILRIDPSQVQAQERLVKYNQERGLVAAPSAPVAVPAAVPAAAPAAAESAPAPVPVPVAEEPVVLVDAPLESVDLGRAAVGARQRLEGGVPSGIFEIPVEIEVENAAEAAEDAETAREALVSTPLFSDLSPASLLRLINKLDFVELPAGEELFHQGDEGTTLYVVVEGRISIVGAGADGQETILGELRDGEFFGELALVTKQPRSATIRALVDSELLAISRQVLSDLIREERSVLTVLLRFLRDRLVENLMQTSPLFAPFLVEQRKELMQRFTFLEVESGKDLLRQGQHSTALFIVLAGELEVEREEEDGSKRALATLGSGDLFGEMSLLAQAEAVATVRSNSKCLLLELPRDVFRETIMTHPHVLAFVGDLASERERQLAAVAGGDEQYEELHLDLF